MGAWLASSSAHCGPLRLKCAPSVGGWFLLSLSFVCVFPSNHVRALSHECRRGYRIACGSSEYRTSGSELGDFHLDLCGAWPSLEGAPSLTRTLQEVDHRITCGPGRAPRCESAKSLMRDHFGRMTYDCAQTKTAQQHQPDHPQSDCHACPEDECTTQGECDHLSNIPATLDDDDFFFYLRFFSFFILLLLAFLFIFCFFLKGYLHSGRSKVTRVVVGRDTNQSYRFCKVNLAALKVAIFYIFTILTIIRTIKSIITNNITNTHQKTFF